MSREAVGSSSNKIGKSLTKVIAILTRCCSPPEKVAGGRFQRFSGIANFFRISFARLIEFTSVSPRLRSGSATRSSVEIRGITRKN